jgi:hypothetical protein
VLTDLDRAGYSLRMVAATLQIPYETLRSRRAGSEPRFQDGEAIVSLWCRVKQREVEAIPRLAGGQSLSAARVR